MLEDNIKKLIKILEESKIDQLEVSTFWGKQKIKISKKSDHIIDRNKIQCNLDRLTPTKAQTN